MARAIRIQSGEPMTDALRIGTGTLALLSYLAAPADAQSAREAPPRIEFGVVAAAFPGAANLALGFRTTIYGSGTAAFIRLRVLRHARMDRACPKAG